MENLSESIMLLAREVHELHKSIAEKANNAILHRLAEMETKIMSAISDYTDRVNAAFDTVSASVDDIVTAQGGIAADVAFLKAEIVKLQNSPGAITPADQASLDALEARVATLSAKTQAVSTALKDLDAATESAPPAPPA